MWTAILLAEAAAVAENHPVAFQAEQHRAES